MTFYTRVVPTDIITARNEWRSNLAQTEAVTMERLQVANARMLQRLSPSINGFLRDYTALEETGNRVLARDISELSSFDRLLLQIEVENRDFAALIRANSLDASENAVLAGSQAARGMTLSSAGPLAGEIGNVWLDPNPAALAQLAGYVDSEAMVSRLARFGDYHSEFVRDGILSLTAQGKGSRQIARYLSGWTNLPYSQAENIVRTSQQWSYRTAAHQSYRQNQKIVTGWMWYAALDTRVCPSCIARHGTQYSHDDILNDHHRGRCTPLPIVKGTTWHETTERGSEWFTRQPLDVQTKLMGKARLRALQEGAIHWTDLSEPYRDGVYGEMTRAASLESILSGRSRRYYRQAPLSRDRERVLTGDGYRLDDSNAFSQVRSIKDLDQYIMQNGDSLRGGYMWNTGALQFDNDGALAIDNTRLKDYIKQYVRQSRSSYESRDYIASITQSVLRDDHGVNVTAEVAERVINADEARRAQALLKLAEVGRLRLTEPQTRRLLQASSGEYLDMIFDEVGETGTFLNSVQSARARSSGVRRDSAEYRRLKDDFDRIMGRGQYFE